MKNKVLVDTYNLYHWHKNWNRIQKSFFVESYELYEKSKIENFVKENNFKNTYVIKDNFIDFNFNQTTNLEKADLILITDQKFSRSKCVDIIKNIEKMLDGCNNLFVCLNRHYLNITGVENDKELPDDYEESIEIWLKNSLSSYKIKNYSEKFIDDGSYFTWVIPDQKFHICKQ